MVNVINKYRHIQIHERCLRDTKYNQLWEAYGTHGNKVGPTVQTTSRKSVRGEARAAFIKKYSDGEN